MTKIILVGAVVGAVFITGGNAITTEDAKSGKTPGIAVASDSSIISARESYLARASRTAERKRERAITAHHLLAKKEKRKREAARAERNKARTVVVTTVAKSKPVSRANRPKGTWLELAKCESGANLTRNSGNGYYGAYQFSQSTWEGFTHGRFGPVLEAGWKVQTYVAYRIWLKQGWNGFPGCGRKMGHPDMPEVPAP